MNKEELDLLEIVFTLAIGECAYNDINNIQKLEDKIKTIGNLCKKQKEVIKDLSKENQALKKQLEENKDKINWYENFEINKTIDELRIKHNNQQKKFIDYLENGIYSIEPKGTGINYNCEYDSEEDYINAMEEQSKLDTFKEILSKYREIIGVSDDKTN